MNQCADETKEKLIKAAAEELQSHGVRDFSLRRVADCCNLSPGAPYKHFSGKNGLILAVLKYYNNKWYEIHSEICEKQWESMAEKLTEISVAYIRFLCDNPEYQSIIMMNDNSMEPEQLLEKSKVSVQSGKLISEYCNSVNMSKEDEIRKTYAVRSFIYGAAIMINSGNLPYDDSSLNNARACIRREFDLP